MAIANLNSTKQAGFLSMPLILLFLIFALELAHLQKMHHLRAKLDSNLNEFLNLKSELVQKSAEFLVGTNVKADLDFINSPGKYGILTKLSLPKFTNPSILTFSQNSIPQINWNGFKGFLLIANSPPPSHYPILEIVNLNIKSSSISLFAKSEIRGEIKFTISSNPLLVGFLGSVNADSINFQNLDPENKNKHQVIMALGEALNANLIQTDIANLEVILMSTSSNISIHMTRNFQIHPCLNSWRNSCYVLTSDKLSTARFKESSPIEIRLPDSILQRPQIIGTDVTP